MPETLPLQIGAFGLLLLVVYLAFKLVSSGQIVPRATVDALLAARDAEIERANHRGDEWHKAFEGERHVSELVREQNRELIEVARTVEHVMESLGAVVSERRTDAPA